MENGNISRKKSKKKKVRSNSPQSNGSEKVIMKKKRVISRFKENYCNFVNLNSCSSDFRTDR